MGLGVDAPTDVLVGAVIGVAVSVAAYRLFVPSEVFPVAYRRGRSAHLDVGGRRGEAIRDALADQLGLTVVEVKPFGLSGSAGSTPLRIQVQDGAGDTRYVFGKLYARSHLRADRSYKFARALRYGRLEDEKPFSTVRRLVQQEDYALSLMQRAGLPSPQPYGVAELTPEREYLIVFEFLDGATELGEAGVDDAVIDQGLAIVRKLWDANLAHRDIKPANLLVRGGKLYLIDVFFAQLHPSPWRQAVDLANMLLCLALRSSPQQVYQRALRRFSVGEINEAFAAARGLALPSQLRRMMRDQGRDLHGEFVRLLPTPPRPIGVQRWSARRVGLLLLVLVALIPAVPMAWAFASSSANPDAGAAGVPEPVPASMLRTTFIPARVIGDPPDGIDKCDVGALIVAMPAEAEGLDRPPYPGAIGKRIYENVSKEAWKLWLEHMKMIMNEYRLAGGSEQANQVLFDQAEKFFFGEGAQLRIGRHALHVGIGDEVGRLRHGLDRAGAAHEDRDLAEPRVHVGIAARAVGKRTLYTLPGTAFSSGSDRMKST